MTKTQLSNNYAHSDQAILRNKSNKTLTHVKKSGYWDQNRHKKQRLFA